MTLQAVARHLQVSWDIVKDIVASSLQKRFRRPKLSKLKRIAIDEICIGHGHRYLTIVMDLLSGAVVYVGDGKDSKALAPFWRSLKNSRAKLQAVATDMSPAYTKSVRENAPDAIHVYDRFHVVKLFNEKLSQLRREVHREASSEKKKVLKGTRWLLLKNPENLDVKKDEKARLKEALDLNTPLTLGYYLKEDLRQIWEQANKRTARKVLKDWIVRARATEVRMLVQMANTMEEHMEGILAWYDCPISTGPLEGVNNKIKTMTRQAYGYRDREFFKLKILGLHESQYALVG
jgi:transposase